MKQKLITIVLTLTIILSQILSIPTSMFDSSNIAKCVVLLAGGLILLILLLASYKTLTIDKKDAFILLFLRTVAPSVMPIPRQKLCGLVLGSWSRE